MNPGLCASGDSTDQGNLTKLEWCLMVYYGHGIFLGDGVLRVSVHQISMLGGHLLRARSCGYSVEPSFQPAGTDPGVYFRALFVSYNIQSKVILSIRTMQLLV